MKLITDHSTWCDRCGEYLSVANPAVRTSYEVLCLKCVNAIRDALMAQVAEDMAREFGNLHPARRETGVSGG